MLVLPVLPALVNSAMSAFLPPKDEGYALMSMDTDHETDPADGPPPNSRSFRRLATLFVAVVATAVLSTSLQLYIHRGPSRPPPQKLSKVVIRTAEDNGAGIGSVTEQLAGSVVFAEVFGAEVFALESLSAQHGYDTVQLLNTMRETRLDVDYSRVCAISRYFSADAFWHFTRAVCEATLKGEPLKAADQAAAQRMEGCTVFIDDFGWRHDPDLAPCTWRQTARQFRNPVPRTVGSKVSVGLHIRWGDMATGGFSNDPMSAYRSIPIGTAKAVVKGLEICLGPLDIRLYMEKHNSTILGAITHPFTLVDSGKDLTDLVDLAANQVLIVAGSSYTELAHHMARGGLTIVPDEDGNRRYWTQTGTHEVLKWKDLSATSRDCKEIRRQYASGLERSRREIARTTARGDAVEGTVLVHPTVLSRYS